MLDLARLNLNKNDVDELLDEVIASADTDTAERIRTKIAKDPIFFMSAQKSVIDITVMVVLAKSIDCNKEFSEAVQSVSISSFDEDLTFIQRFIAKMSSGGGIEAFVEQTCFDKRMAEISALLA